MGTIVEGRADLIDFIDFFDVGVLGGLFSNRFKEYVDRNLVGLYAWGSVHPFTI